MHSLSHHLRMCHPAYYCADQDCQKPPTLAVLKTNNSSFTNFQRDAYTTLQEVTDRIFSTTVALMYDVILPEEGEGLTIEGLKDLGQEIGFEKVSNAFVSLCLRMKVDVGLGDG